MWTSNAEKTCSKRAACNVGVRKACRNQPHNKNIIYFTGRAGGGGLYVCVCVWVCVCVKHSKKTRQLSKQQQRNGMQGAPQETTKSTKNNAAQCYPMLFLLPTVGVKSKKREENKNSVHTTVFTVNNNGAKTDSIK